MPEGRRLEKLHRKTRGRAESDGRTEVDSRRPNGLLGHYRWAGTLFFDEFLEGVRPRGQSDRGWRTERRFGADVAAGVLADLLADAVTGGIKKTLKVQIVGQQ